MVNYVFWFTLLIQVVTGLVIALIIAIPLVLLLYWLHLKIIKKNIPEKVIEQAEKEKTTMKGGENYGNFKLLEKEKEEDARYETIRDRIRAEIREQPRDQSRRPAGNSTRAEIVDIQRPRLSDERSSPQTKDFRHPDENRVKAHGHSRGWKRL